MPQILDGKATAAAIKSELTERVEALKARGITPGLGTVLVGDDPASHSYVGAKHRDCAQIGINSIRVDLPAEITQEELEAEIDKLNHDPACTSYIVQLPLPKHLDTNRILEKIAPEKDADGLHPTNLGKLVLNDTGLILAAALDGQGLAYSADQLVAEHLTAGRLVRVLADFSPRIEGFCLYYPNRRISVTLRALVEMLKGAREPAAH